MFLKCVKPQLKEYLNGTKEWWLDGKRHREDGPAVEWADGTKQWWLNGECHREDGPAVEGADGYKAWWLDGKRHREDGPAVEYASGTKEWWLNGKLHRVDGPAIEYPDGKKEWYLNGQHVFDNRLILSLKGNYIVIERGIPTDIMFGNVKLTVARLLTDQGTISAYDDLPGIDILD